MNEQQKDTRVKSIENFHNYMQSLLSDEQRERFQRLGEKLYKSFDVYKGELLKSEDDSKTIKLEEALAYVVESLKSGLHPKYLDEDEIHLLRSAYGDEWYKLWNYKKEDL
jgi:hypothetical protein